MDITDAVNRLIARVHDHGSYLEIVTPVGQPLGRYLKESDMTVDMLNRPIGRGNMLALLIKDIK